MIDTQDQAPPTAEQTEQERAAESAAIEAAAANHVPAPEVAEHQKRVEPTTARTVAPWIERLPDHLRAEAESAKTELARRAALPAAELAELEARERGEREQEAKTELLSVRAGQRWAMWCDQVPALYRDDRADREVRTPQSFGFWLQRLADDQNAAQIEAWLRDRSARTLWLFGSTGTGKTLAGICAGYAAASMAVHARFTTQLDYLQQLRPGVDDNPTRVRKRYTETSLLVLDDLGAETGDASQFVRQELLTLLDTRLNEGRKQIITTNVDADALADTFGDRIMDRLRADAAVLKYKGASRRVGRSPW